MAGLEEFEWLYSSSYRIGAFVNDQPTPAYPQAHPKDRVLAYLRAMARGEELTTEESMEADAAASEATPGQRAYVAGLLDSRVVPSSLRSRIAEAEPLTDADCREFIPLLTACAKSRLPRYESIDDCTLPVDWGDENGGYSSPDSPTGYTPC